MTIRRWSCSALLCVLLIPASACSLFAGEPKVIEGDQPTLLVGVDSGEMMDALLEGYLTDVGGCYGVAMGSRDVAVIVWPEGTEVQGSGDDAVVRLPDDNEIAFNDEFSLSGGFVAPRSDSVPDNDCDVAEYFLANSPQR